MYFRGGGGKRDCLIIISFALQFLHPLETKHYYEAVSTRRIIGRECISNRIKALDNGERGST